MAVGCRDLPHGRYRPTEALLLRKLRRPGDFPRGGFFVPFEFKEMGVQCGGQLAGVFAFSVTCSFMHR